MRDKKDKNATSVVTVPIVVPGSLKIAPDPAQEPSKFPIPTGLTRADRRRIEVLAGVLLRDPA